MLTEDFVSFETAKLLKEKGFDEPTNRYYNAQYGMTRTVSDTFMTYWNDEDHMKALMMEGALAIPTHQMAMKWLREVHKLLISVDASPIYGKVKDEKGRNTCSLLYWHYMASGEWVNEKYNPNQKAFVVSAKSYEDAVEVACIYALKNLL